MKKIILVTEYIDPPYDEGIKKTVFNLFNELTKKYEVKVICRHGFEHEWIDVVNTNTLFLSGKIKNTIIDFRPDVLIYFPFASTTFAGYLRCFILSFFSGKSHTLLVALQPKPLKKWQQTIVRLIKPKIALTPSPSLKEFWDAIGVRNEILPLLTDRTIFRPASNSKIKNTLREKYKIQKHTFVISHMGHLNEGRNLKSLLPLQKAGNQVVVVGSSSTPLDAIGTATLKSELEGAGIRIIDGYLEQIAEIYQLSDVYIFPVVEPNSSIGMPLSILEARSCGLPVLTTEFGSIKSFIGSDHGGVFYAEPDDFLESINAIKNIQNKVFTKTKIQDLNDRFFQVFFTTIDKCTSGRKSI